MIGYPHAAHYGCNYINSINYPSFLVFIYILLHNSSQTGAEIAANVTGSILQKVSTSLALPYLGGLQQLRSIVSLVYTASANLTCYYTIFGELSFCLARLATPRRLCQCCYLPSCIFKILLSRFLSCCAFGYYYLEPCLQRKIINN